MFPKCSMNARNIATLREHLANVPGILRAGWVVGLKLIQLEQQKAQLLLSILAKSLKPIPCRVIKGT